MKRFIVVLSILLLAGCSAKESKPIIERTYSDGVVIQELPSDDTYDSDDLPQGIEPNDVAVILTVQELPDDRKGPEGAVAKKKTAISDKVIITKKGKVFTGEEASPVINKVETVKKSYKWLWWILIVIAAVSILGAGIGNVMKPFDLIMRFFKR